MSSAEYENSNPDKDKLVALESLNVKCSLAELRQYLAESNLSFIGMEDYSEYGKGLLLFFNHNNVGGTTFVVTYQAGMDLIQELRIKSKKVEDKFKE